MVSADLSFCMGWLQHMFWLTICMQWCKFCSLINDLCTKTMVLPFTLMESGTGIMNTIIYFNTSCVKPHSPDLNRIEPFSSILETRQRSRFQPPTALSELASFFQEEWLRIPVTIVHCLYLSIPRRIHAVINATRGPRDY